MLKQRVTHDLTFHGPPGKSANIHTPEHLLDDCIYGFNLLRNFAQHPLNETRHKNTRILVWKTDMDEKYRSIHTSYKTALSCMIQLENLAYIFLRIPFGAMIAGGRFSIISITAVDLASDFIRQFMGYQIHSFRSICIYWKYLHQNSSWFITFWSNWKIVIDMHDNDIDFDCYIDDLIDLALETLKIDNVFRL